MDRDLTARLAHTRHPVAAPLRECDGTWGIDRPRPGTEGTKV
ncbi:hypothetical protein ACIHFE_19075 [Streptomyces sp. NPDC052396]